MRQKILLLIILIGNLACFAQDLPRYGELLCEGLSWGYNGKTMIESCEISGSKMKNDKLYGLLHLERVYYGSRALLPTDGQYSEVIGIRDEKGRIYVDKEEYLNLMTGDSYWSYVGRSDSLPYETTPDGELVLYDFNKNAGEVYCKMPDESELTVTKVDTLKTEDGVSRRRLTLSNGLDLIEGVGCTNSQGLLLFWLNPKASYVKNLYDYVLLTGFSKDGKRILARDYDTTIKELNGYHNKMFSHGRRWVYDYNNGETKGTLTYSIEGDTLLYGYRRAKINMTLTDNRTNKILRTGYAGAFFEQEDCICYLEPGSSKTCRLYKLTWQSGHTYYLYDEMWYYVLHTDEVKVGNDSFRRLHLLNMRSYDEISRDKSKLYYWVEGIGSSRGLLDYKAGTLMDSIQFVGCYDGDKCVFAKEDLWRESDVPYCFSVKTRVDSLLYQLDASAGTARLIRADDSLHHCVIPSFVDLWGMDFSVNKIEDEAFLNRKNLISVEIPESISSIGKRIFSGCTSLCSAKLPSTIDSIGESTFYGCERLDSIILPEGITKIGQISFAKCSALKRVDLPASIAAIEDNAFRECTGLEHVYCHATTVPSTGNSRHPFYKSSYQQATLHVPSASVNLYKKTEPWNGFKSIVPIEEETDAIMAQKSEPDTHLLFDLQGHPVKDAPKHGIYVKDGRKVIR